MEDIKLSRIFLFILVVSLQATSLFAHDPVGYQRTTEFLVYSGAFVSVIVKLFVMDQLFHISLKKGIAYPLLISFEMVLFIIVYNSSQSFEIGRGSYFYVLSGVLLYSCLAVLINFYLLHHSEKKDESIIYKIFWSIILSFIYVCVIIVIIVIGFFPAYFFFSS